MLCLWMYTVMVRPVLTYGIVVYWANQTWLQQQPGCNRSKGKPALISGCTKSTPLAALDILPTSSDAASYAHSAGSNGGSSKNKIHEPVERQCQINKPHCSILDKATKTIFEAIKGTDRITTTYLTNKRYQMARQ